MKTIKSIIALVLLAALAGCNSDNAPSGTGLETNSPAAQGASANQLTDATAPTPALN